MKLVFIILFVLSAQANATTLNFGTGISDEEYNATTWDSNTTIAPSKNAVRDKIETIGSASVSDTAYGAGWNGVTTVAPSKNAVYDQIETIGSASVSDEEYNATSWDGNTTIAPSKNAVRDKFESLGTGGDVVGPATNTDEYVPQWNGPNSKTLEDGFQITAAGKSILDDASVTVMRTTLGLGTAAVRAAEDTLTDGSNLPDGAAIKAYGDATWGVTGVWNDAGDYIWPDSGYNYRIIDSGTDLSTVTFAANVAYILAPGTVYYISGTITISNSNVTVIGNGVTITKQAAVDGITLSGSHCRIDGLKINGNTYGSSGVFITGSYNLIDGVTTYSNGGNGIAQDGQSTTCQYNRIVNCTSYSNSGIGFSLNDVDYAVVSNNVAYNNTLEGFTCDANSPGWAYGCVFDGNVAYNNVGGVGGFGIDRAEYCVLSNNVIDSSGSNDGMKTQNNQGPVQYCVFSGNTLLNNGGYGINITTGAGGASNHNKLVGNIYQNNTSGDYYVIAGQDNVIIETASGGSSDWSPLLTTVGATPAPVIAVRGKIDRVVQDTSGLVEGGLGDIYSSYTYATLGVGGIFTSSETGVGTPATALAVYARNNNSSNDVCGIWARADSWTSYDIAFGGNVIAAAPSGLTSVKLVGFEIDVQPASGTTCSSASAGLYINAYNIDIPGPGIQLGSINNGHFNNGLVVAGVASTGAGITFNSSTLNYGIYMDTPSYTTAAIHLGDTDKILFNTSGIWANGSNLTFYDPIAGTKTLSELVGGAGSSLFTDAGTYIYANNSVGFKIYDNDDVYAAGNIFMGKEMVYNNNKALLMKNTAGTNTIGLRLNASNDWEIGLDARYVVLGYGSWDSNPLLIRVNGVNNKQVTVDAINTAGTGFRALRVPN
jgi:hypothetical protein